MAEMTAAARIEASAPVVRREHRSHHSRSNKEALRLFASALVCRRAQLGLTRSQVAKEVGVSYSNMSHFELGDNWPTLPVYRALCRVLKAGEAPMMK